MFTFAYFSSLIKAFFPFTMWGKKDLTNNSSLKIIAVTLDKNGKMLTARLLSHPGFGRLNP